MVYALWINFVEAMTAASIFSKNKQLHASWSDTWNTRDMNDLRTENKDHAQFSRARNFWALLRERACNKLLTKLPQLVCKLHVICTRPRRHLVTVQEILAGNSIQSGVCCDITRCACGLWYHRCIWHLWWVHYSIEPSQDQALTDDKTGLLVKAP